MKKVNTEEEGHKFETGVVFEDRFDGFGCGNGVTGGGDEGLGGDPKVVVVEEGDRIPFACIMLMLPPKKF